MAFKVEIIQDSISPLGKRITTLTATYPRFLHSELLTHRDRARNAASSRAIPWRKMRDAVITEPVVPIKWGVEQKGMRTGDELPPDLCDQAVCIWKAARNDAVKWADALAALGVHKSLVNRLIEPFAWITVVMTATEWNNFFRLRCHPDAEIHFQKIACMMRDALAASKPVERIWHLPFVQEDELGGNPYDLAAVSTARCARVSYLTHDGVRDQAKDQELFDKLCQGSGFGHWSPHEHPAEADVDPNHRSGPFVGWNQFRKTFSNENVEG